MVLALEHPHSQLRVVLTLRADFYDRPLQMPQLAELMQAHTEVVVPLNSAELEHAITQPAALAGVRFAPTLVNRIIDDVRGQAGMLPLLQYALTELFEHRDQENRVIPLEAYEATGGVLGVLGQRAEEIFGGFSAENQVLARQIFLRLVTLGEGVEDTRRRVLQSELEQVGVKREEWRAESTFHPSSFILHPFSAARLLSFDRDPATRTPTVEVAHEALLREWPRLREWLRESREDLRLQRRLGVISAEWQQANRDESILLRGGQLTQFEGWAEQTTVALTTDEQSFLDASIELRNTQHAAEKTRRQRELAQAQKLAETERQRSEEATLRAAEQTAAASRLRQRAFLLAGALAVAAVLAVAAFIFGNRATANANLAATREVEAETNAAAAQVNANLAATREVEAQEQAAIAQENADLAATREVEAQENAIAAQSNADLAATREAEAQTQRTLAEEQARLALARELAAQANIALEIDPELSLLLALQSLDIAHTNDAETALHIGLQNSRIRERHDLGVEYGVISQNRQRIALVKNGTTEFEVRDLETLEVLFTGDGVVQWFIDDQLLIVQTSPLFEGPLALEVWDVSKGEVVDYPIADRYPIPRDETTIINSDQTFALFATSLATGEVKLWNAATGDEIATLLNHGIPIASIAFDPDGTRLVVIDFANQVFAWDTSAALTTGIVSRLDTLSDTFGTQPGRQGRFSYDGSKFMIDTDTGFRIWDLLSPDQPPIVFDGTDQTPQQGYWSQDGSIIAVPDAAGGIFVVDATTGELILLLNGHQLWAQVAGISADNSTLYSIGEDGALREWDITPLAGSETIAFPNVALAGRMTINPDGSILGVGSLGGPAQLIDRHTGHIIHTLETTSPSEFDLDFSPDGSKVTAVTGNDDFIHTFDAATGELLHEFEGHTSATFGNFFPGIMDVEYAPDGKHFATASSDNVVKLWDAETYELVRTFEGYPDSVGTIAFSPDGAMLFAGGDGQSNPEGAEAWAFDVESGEQRHMLGNVPAQIFSIAVHPTEPIVAMSGWGGVIKGWNYETGSELYHIDAQGGGVIWEMAMSRDGHYLAISGGSALPAIFDARNGELISTLSDIPAGHLVFTPDNRLLSGHFFEGAIREFVVELEDALALARERTTREMTEAECLQYLRNAECEVLIGDVSAEN